MHQCVKYGIGTSPFETKFSTLCKKSRQERREEACCSVCHVIFCCAKDRERHEDAEHGRKIADKARQQRQVFKANKPLVCLNCCQVFLSGLFVNVVCNNVSYPTASKVNGTTHVLITIPEWAVKRYLVPKDRKRSWEKANEEVVQIMVHPAVGKAAEDCNPVEESSFTQKRSIQSILAKHRKTDLAEKRGRRVTFSPITAVAFTSRLSIVQVGTQETGGDSSSDSTPNSSGTPIRSKPPELQSFNLEAQVSAAQTPKETTESPSLPNNDPLTPSVGNVGDNADCVFSPPLMDGSPMMTPQMSSTPVTENSERINASTLEEEASAPSEGIFSSLANVICCAFQALPSVLAHFFSSINHHTEQESSSVGRHRRQRRRSATFTPYNSITKKRRQWSQKKGQPLSPLPMVKFLQSPKRSS